jgi:hypothetical protein
MGLRIQRVQATTPPIHMLTTLITKDLAIRLTNIAETATLDTAINSHVLPHKLSTSDNTTMTANEVNVAAINLMYDAIFSHLCVFNP